MAPLIATRLVAAAVVAHLDSLDGISAHLSVGATPPAGRTVVVHPLPASYAGPLGDPDRDAVVRFQTTSIGGSGEQALWTHDKVAARLLRSEVAIAGGVSLPIWQVPGSHQPVQRDDDLATPWFYVTCAWTAHVQPT